MKRFIYAVLMIGMSTKFIYAATATATMVATSTSSQISGVIALEDTKDGLKISATIQNAKPGNHGFHIHEFGSCADSGKAAGGHYNPTGAPHGQILKDGPAKAHAGDLGNFVIGSNGTGTLNTTIPGITLTDGTLNVAGRAIIFHEKEDDFGQPLGNTGPRPGCGTIIITGK